jgi:hypothetical protein
MEVGTRNESERTKLRQIRLVLAWVPEPDRNLVDPAYFLNVSGCAVHFWGLTKSELRNLGIGYQELAKALGSCRGGSGDRSESLRRWLSGRLPWADLMTELAWYLADEGHSG